MNGRLIVAWAVVLFAAPFVLLGAVGVLAWDGVGIGAKAMREWLAEYLGGGA